MKHNIFKTLHFVEACNLGVDVLKVKIEEESTLGSKPYSKGHGIQNVTAPIFQSEKTS